MFSRFLQSSGRRAISKGIALTGLVLASAVPVSADNLISNSEFSDATVLPWSDDSLGSLYLSHLDHSGNLDSGSALIVDDNNDSFYGTVLRSECMAVSGGAPVDISGWFKGGSSFPSNSKYRIGREYFSSSNCGTFLTTVNGSLTNVPSGWNYESHQHTAPTAARAVRMTITALSSTNSNLDLLADGLTLNSSPSALPGTIFESNFDSGGFAGWTVEQ